MVPRAKKGTFEGFQPLPVVVYTGGVLQDLEARFPNNRLEGALTGSREAIVTTEVWITGRWRALLSDLGKVLEYRRYSKAQRGHSRTCVALTPEQFQKYLRRERGEKGNSGE